MKSEISLKTDDQNLLPFQNNIPEFSIFSQMELLGINPDPFIEIAAHDLLNQYGIDTLSHSRKILNDFTARDDLQSAEIWQKIIKYLEELNGTGDLIAH